MVKYKLTKDYMGHKAGSVFEQNEYESKTLNFKLVIGDPEYFELVDGVKKPKKVAPKVRPRKARKTAITRTVKGKKEKVSKDAK